MRKIVFLFALCLQGLFGFSQGGMSTKQFNFTSFSEDKKASSPLLDKHSSAQAKLHPEYGVLPYDAKCTDCMELIDQRSAFSRQYIDTKRAGHTYSEESYFPMHYRDQQNRWRTIDYRLRPVPAKRDVYAATHQRLPVKFDLAGHYTSIDVNGFEFIHNHDLSLYFVTDKDAAATNIQLGNYSSYIVGDDGCRIHNMWPGIDMEAFADAGQIETNFLILDKPVIPITTGYMVIEDHISLPQGYTLEGSGGKIRYRSDDLVVKNSSGHIVATMEHVKMRNRSNVAFFTDYVITRSGNDYSIRILVPISLLNESASEYPIVVDPIVSGADSLGEFASSGRPGRNMNFTTLPGHCDYHMTVQVPGMSQLLGAYADVESQTTSNFYCGDTTFGNGHSCLKREIIHRVFCDTCHTNEILYCGGVVNCDTPGTLTTDYRVVPGAGPIPLIPNFVTCLPPQCPDYFLKFTLWNSDSSCQDNCGQLCAKGNKWRMVIEACQIDANITANPVNVCAGQPVTLTCHPSCGVPPYHYDWSNGMHGQVITIYPQQDVIIGCTAYDTCNNFVLTNDIDIFVTQSPSADAGTDKTLCEGGTVTIGGSPTTTSSTASITWTATPASAQSWISSSTAANPTITVPVGTVDTTLYEVRTDDNTCFRLDSVYVFSIANPVAVIDTTGSTRICNGQSVTLQANGPFTSYQWNNGGTGQSQTISTPGSYYVIVTDANQCKDTSNRITISRIQIPAIHAYPDTMIFYGGSVTLYSDVSLSPPTIDSFFWQPDVSISCMTCPNPIVTPPTDQTYILTAYSKGCTLSDSATITVILPDKYYIPNAFSPNGDGINDTFFLYAQSGVKLHTFVIYNRWGEKVHDGLYAWDGMYKGVLCTPGVYVYVMSLGLSGKTYDEVVKGSVTLIR